MFLANYQDNSENRKLDYLHGVSNHLTCEDFIKGKYEGEYFLVVKGGLIGPNRLPADFWGAERILWWEVLKKAKKIFYLYLILYQLKNIIRI